MPVRTSAVVASGLALLTLVGVGTVFGESLVALVAPPRIEGTGDGTTEGGPGRPAAPPAPSAGAPASPVARGDGVVPSRTPTDGGS